MGFRFLEHTADARAECWATQFDELLVAAAQALYTLALQTARAETDVRREIALSAETREEMLVRWLQELIFLLDTEQFVAREYDFLAVGPDGVRARLAGYTCAIEERQAEVKAATYHGMVVRETAEGLKCEVVFDL